MSNTVARAWSHGLFALPLIFLIASQAFADNAILGLRIPPGFAITEFADSRLANDIFAMAIDPRGRVVVSGPGYIRILVDDDGDGKADRALPFADGPNEGAQGLLWEGDALYFTANGGLRRYRVAKGDGRVEGPSELIWPLRTGGEHNAHAIRRGPDGWLYVLCGDQAGVGRREASLATSPIHDPVGGAVLRLTPDLKACEVVADGFRNPYAMDFNAEGELCTFDSDNERCVSLPWYESTRFYHVLPGGHYGWQAPQRAQTWRCPPYFCDMVAPVAHLGRGSPTGVACYRHSQFPDHYRGGVFLADWTFGRIFFLSLQRAGASYHAQSEVFLQAVGDNGFAPTALAVHPQTGDLYVAIGGRGTHGAVYSIRYTAGSRSPLPITTAAPSARSLDWSPSDRDEWLRLANSGMPPDRFRTLALLRRHRERFSAAEISRAIQTNWNHPDRAIRQASAALIRTLDRDARQELRKQLNTPAETITWGLGCLPDDATAVLTLVTPLLAAEREASELRLDAVRLIQLALGDLMDPRLKGTVWEGYSARQKTPSTESARALQVLRRMMPTGQPELDREIARTFALIADGDSGTVQTIADRLTTASDPVDDIHYLIVLARLCGPRSPETTARSAGALLALDRKLTERRRNRDRNWPLRIVEMYAELVRQDPALNAALLTSLEFGRPDHALFARAGGFDRRRAAEIFLSKAAANDQFAWTAELVELLGELPHERIASVLRRLGDRSGLEDAILPILAQKPEATDRERFLRGLGSPQLQTVACCLTALEQLPHVRSEAQFLALIRAMRRLPAGKEAEPLRARLARSLQASTGQSKLGSDPAAWRDWFARTYPRLASQLDAADGVDVVAWKGRLARLDWTRGHAERGGAIFEKAGCAACHTGSRALGPDLRGVTRRFSRDDLFTAILQPSRDIAPRYRTILIATDDGKVYQGLVAYEAVDSLLLQTGPTTTVRLDHARISSRRLTDASLMPTGLLDRLTDQEIADLYQFLKTLAPSDGAGRDEHSGPAAPNGQKHEHALELDRPPSMD